MKKVLLVIPTLFQGGGQKFVMDLAKGLDKTKFNVRVLVFFKKTDSVFDRFAEENGIDTVYLDKKLGLDFSFFKKVKKAVREYDPDIIHTHLNSMLYLFPSYRKKHIKLHTVHTMAQKENYRLQKIVNFIAFHFLGVVPVGICDSVAKSICITHKLNPTNVPTVYNGVFCERYAKSKVVHKGTEIVTVGNIHRVKNYAFLVECFSEICKQTDDVRLTIVGDGVLRKDVEKQIDALGIGDKVTITGVVGNVEDYLCRSDIYVCSSFFEGLPLSVLEAMSAGLPVVSTNVGGLGDVVKDNENGFLVELGDKEGYVNALGCLINNVEKRRVFSEKSVELSKKYDERLTVEGYEKLYQK